MKEIIHIRKKKLAQGGYSLYFDVYYKGVRKYEFLNLYLTEGKTRQDKMLNNETIRIAETLKAKRILEIEAEGLNILVRSNETIVDFIQSEIDRKKSINQNFEILEASLKYVSSFFQNTKLCNLNKTNIMGFRQYLMQQSKLKYNSKMVYLRNIKTALFKAEQTGKISKDILVAFGTLAMQETARVYLTMNEIQLLMNTDFQSSVLKRAFLFACLTGIRGVDIIQLKWANVTTSNGFTRIIFVQKKTNGQEYLDISEQAAALLGERKNSDDQVFEGLNNSEKKNKKKLMQWVNSVGIDKNITFHSSRHTFAVMMLELGVNIAVIQKLLGHRELSTTMIYAKVLDKSKREAVNLIPKFL